MTNWGIFLIRSPHGIFDPHDMDENKIAGLCHDAECEKFEEVLINEWGEVCVRDFEGRTYWLPKTYRAIPNVMYKERRISTIDSEEGDGK